MLNNFPFPQADVAGFIKSNLDNFINTGVLPYGANKFIYGVRYENWDDLRVDILANSFEEAYETAYTHGIFLLDAGADPTHINVVAIPKERPTAMVELGYVFDSGDELSAFAAFYMDFLEEQKDLKKTAVDEKHLLNVLDGIYDSYDPAPTDPVELFKQMTKEQSPEVMDILAKQIVELVKASQKTK